MSDIISPRARIGTMQLCTAAYFISMYNFDASFFEGKSNAFGTAWKYFSILAGAYSRESGLKSKHIAAEQDLKNEP